MKLSLATLADLAPSVTRPTYDRAAVRPGILHIGVGNFHRAHQAVYLNDLLNSGGDPSWGICGAGVRPTDAAMRDRLAAQDWLSTVIEVDQDGRNASVIGAMIDFLPIEPGHAPISASIADPVTRIISLTVTEGGYFISPKTGEFDTTHPDIRADAAGGAPVSVFGAIVAGLRARRAAGVGPVTVMSCDNLPGNGNVTRSAVLGLARLIDADTAEWIDENVTFPNGMVDRITPATGPAEMDMVRTEFGIEDAAPVTCEPFRQWVLEDKFAAGRPDFKSAGVILTPHVHDYEAMKIRILNGGHAIIAYPGGLLSIDLVHEAMQHPAIAAFMEKVIRDEVIPNVPHIPGTSPENYLAQVIHRFQNPGVRDTVTRLCRDGSNRQPKFIVPSIYDNIPAGRSARGLALASAFWCRYCLGQTEDGSVIAPNDPNWDRLQDLARAAQTNPDAWLSQDDVYGDLGQSALMQSVFADALESVGELGVVGAINRYIEQG